jgi:CHAT domain-containing protein
MPRATGFVLILFLATISPADCKAQDLSRAQGIFHAAQQYYAEGQYKKAADTLTIAIEIFTRSNNIVAQVKAMCLQGESFSSLNQCDKAIGILTRSVQLAKNKLPADHPEMAQAYYYLSRATGECARKIEDAIGLLRKSMNAKKKLYGPESLEVCYDYTFMGFLFDNKEQPDSALSYLNKALAIREKKLSPDDIEIAYTLHNLAQVYENQSELSKSLERHLRALNIRQAKLTETHPTTSKSINAIGSVYRKFGNYEMALHYYRLALEIRKKVLGENHSDVSCTYYSIGNLSNAMFDYHTAIQYYLQGHRILENLYGENTDVLPAYYAVTAKMYGMIGEHRLANEYIRKSERVTEKMLSKDHAYRGIAYNLIGDYYAEVNDLRKQSEYCEKAIAIFHKAYGIGSAREGDIHFNMATVSANNKRFIEAIDHYKRALVIFEKKMGKNNPKTASVLHGMGDVSKDQGRFENALAWYQKAFAAISTSFTDDAELYFNPHPDELEGKFLALKIAASKGHSLYEMGRTQKNDPHLLKQSMVTYEFAMQLIDQIRADYSNESAKIELEKVSRKVYTRALQTAYELYVRSADIDALERCFAISEKSKSALLQENIRDHRAKTLAGVPDTLVTRERDTKIEIAYYKNALYQAGKEKNAARSKLFEKNIFDAQQKYDRLKEMLESEFPAYYDFKYNTRNPTITDLKQSLPDNETQVVEFFADDSALYIFSIIKDSATVVRKKIDPLVQRLFANYHKSLTNADFILNSRKEADQLYVQSAYLLYDFLFGSVLTTGEIKKMIIIPDDVLTQFNFGTLVTEKPSTTHPDYKTLEYLTRRCRISYAYSSAFIKKQSIEEKRSRYGFAGFAPSYPGNQFAGLDTALHPMTYQIVRNGGYPLPGAAQEVEYLANFMEGRSWLMKEATETNFKQHAGDYNILHLAMHSLLNDERPEYSELLFNHENDQWNDGYLKVSEIYNLHLNAELVVLSACSSGYGKIQKGEGPISISRAFSYSGCPSVVMSLWKVPDDVTLQVMTFFYQELMNGEEKDEALRLAQLKFVSETTDPLYRHPYFWAGFVVMGNTEPLLLSSSFPLWTIVVISLFIFTAALVTLKLKHSRAVTLDQYDPYLRREDASFRE